MESVHRVYDPPNSYAYIEVNVTEEQAKALDKIAERDEFGAFFWAEKIVWFNNEDKTEDGDKVLRINGDHWVVGKEDVNSFWKGCGGRQQHIKLKNGDIIKSTNLWHQGTIPEELKDILVDNAEWFKEV